MTYRNRGLVREPIALLRGHETEKEELAFLVDYYGGGSPAEIYRKVLLEVAREKRHEANSLSPQRIAPCLDSNPFSQLRAV